MNTLRLTAAAIVAVATLAACADDTTAPTSSLAPQEPSLVVAPCTYLCGTRILYTHGNYVAGTLAMVSSDIYKMKPDGLGVQRLTFGEGMSRDAAWSPDFTKIVFSSSRPNTNGYKLFLMNADGTGVTQLTTGAGTDARPSWSPDGTKIAFTSNRVWTAGTQIFTVNVDGSGLTRLTTDDAHYATPKWAPNGGSIYMTTNRLGDWNIARFDLRGVSAGLKMITQTPQWDEMEIAVSPSGTEIMSYRLDDSYNRYITRHHASTGAVILSPRSSTLKDRTFGNLSYAPDGSSFVYTEFYNTATGSKANTAQVYRFPLDGTAPKHASLTAAGDHNVAGGWAR
jgi:Tol biopolymer transport system component